MHACERLESGAVELYFYGEFEQQERAAFERHASTCEACRNALEELSVIREALDTVPVVDGPPDGDWIGFTGRLEAAIQLEDVRTAEVVELRAGPPRASYAPYLAMAALLALVSMSVAYVARSVRPAGIEPPTTTATSAEAPAAAPIAAIADPEDGSARAALAGLSEQHFERSKLVVLGLANKDPRRASGADWEYERELASDLLVDTRLYRMAAEEKGMKTLASVMRDLELVLLQASLAGETASEDLEQIQRLIHKRDLLGKMNLVDQGI